jgi:hypothetical protein
MNAWKTCGILLFLIVTAPAWGDQKPPERPVSYSRDIKPILTNSCYACHGPDKGPRKAGLRLDVREVAVKKAIRPGHAADSRLIERLTSQDADERMPPPSSKKRPLTAAQIDLLRRWIDQGAKFDVHWSYIKPVRPALPVVQNRSWPRNPIDYFIAAGHEAQHLTPSPPADRITLIRRLSFDLTGLPPNPEEVIAFLQDSNPDAYEKLVERLLASRQFGERMALSWLDLVRYGDSGGYHSDNDREVWLYRDYVINAFNANKPFDQFTIEQLAGDLLSNPTREQRIASGYNRLLMTTEEGGAQPKEYMAKYSADRVRNVSAVWLASTMGCCECHDHKFDPFRTRDFYSLAAFFADLSELPVGRQPQTPMPTEEQQARQRQMGETLAALRRQLDKPTPALAAGQAAWEKRMQVELPTQLIIELLPRPVTPVLLSGSRRSPGNVLAALLRRTPDRTPADKEALAAYYRTLAPELAGLRQQVAALEEEKKRFIQTFPTTLVSMSVTPRTIRILPRGNWLDDSGEIVSPAVPPFLEEGKLPHDGDGSGKTGRLTRLDLARWLVSADNPLVARVFVNRLWKICFGQGLVKSMEDFGSQGELPLHSQLLDWLAVEFRESGWDVKHLLRLMVLSNTYRQWSAAGKTLRERDPANRWLARQNRFRLDAEMLRDNALATSGLLSQEIGGPSVKPYQPAGYWQYLNFPIRDYHADHGENQYRRGLYTWWQRTFLHPSLLAFDAPTREECTAERPRSSTPLQSLVLLNDPTYVEAARVFAEHVMQQGGRSVPDRLAWAFRRALSRPIRPEEIQVLEALYRKHLAEYRSTPDAAARLVHVGERPMPKELDVVELAAWTSVARTILNLHETITRN